MCALNILVSYSLPELVISQRSSHTKRSKTEAHTSSKHPQSSKVLSASSHKLLTTFSDRFLLIKGNLAFLWSLSCCRHNNSWLFLGNFSLLWSCRQWIHYCFHGYGPSLIFMAFSCQTKQMYSFDVFPNLSCCLNHSKIYCSGPYVLLASFDSPVWTQDKLFTQICL